MRVISFILLMMCVICNYAFSDGIFINEQPEALASMRAQIFKMHYGDVGRIKSMIEHNKKKIISSRGVYHVDEGSNQVWVYDDQKHLHILAHMIHAMDQPIHQVNIVAHIINIDEDYLRKIGGELSQRGLVDISSDDFLSIPLGTLTDRRLRYQIDAMVDKGHAKVIAAPKVMTQNRQEAIIEAGSEVPYQEKTGTGNTSVTFKKAVLSLGVVPTVLPHHQIALKIRVNEDQVSSLMVNGVPAIKTQKLITQAIIKDKHTLLIGGITQKNRSHRRKSIPLVGHLPVIGWLLSHHEKSQSEHQLIVLIQPIIVS